MAGLRIRWFLTGWFDRKHAGRMRCPASQPVTVALIPPAASCPGARYAARIEADQEQQHCGADGRHNQGIDVRLCDAWHPKLVRQAPADPIHKTIEARGNKRESRLARGIRLGKRVKALIFRHWRVSNYSAGTVLFLWLA